MIYFALKKKVLFTYSVVSHFKTTPLVIGANNKSSVNHTRSENNKLLTLIFHTFPAVGISQTTISPQAAENNI